MTRDRRTGLPHVDPLIGLAEAERARLDAVIVIGQAEGVLATVRQEELLARQQAAHRRLSAATPV